MAKIVEWGCSQKHVNCFDQGFKCFRKIFLACNWQLLVFTKCKARCDCWYFTSFIKSM